MAKAETETERKLRELSQYQLVDYGEHLIKEFDILRDELHRQALSIGTRQMMIWEVVRTAIVLCLPIITVLALAILSDMFIPTVLANSVALLLLTTSIGFVLLNLPPLNDAVNKFLQYQLYVPNFTDLDCNCIKCAHKADETTNTESTMAGDGNTPLDDKKVFNKLFDRPGEEGDEPLGRLNACGNATSEKCDVVIREFVEKMKNARFSSSNLGGDSVHSSTAMTGMPGTQARENSHGSPTASSGSSESIDLLDGRIDILMNLSVD